MAEMQGLFLESDKCADGVELNSPARPTLFSVSD